MADARFTRVLGLTAAAAMAVTALAGCGGQSVQVSSHAQTGSGMMTMSDGSVMKMSDMPSSSVDGDTSGGPSATARMICGHETADAIQKSLALKDAPNGYGGVWISPDYYCNYRLPSGVLKLTVQDLSATSTQRTTFDSLRSRLSHPTAITGLANFGLKAFQTKRGDVVFLKDNKTLWVNASGIATSGLPAGMSRSDIAYAVASSVIACWRE